VLSVTAVTVGWCTPQIVKIHELLKQDILQARCTSRRPKTNRLAENAHNEPRYLDGLHCIKYRLQTGDNLPLTTLSHHVVAVVPHVCRSTANDPWLVQLHTEGCGS